jgi:hypothetical protein
MSGRYPSHLHGGGGGGGLGVTTILAATFAAAALAAAAYLARVVEPQLASRADTFPSKFYVFVTVQVLIFVIYMLSVYDNKRFHAAAQEHKDPWARAVPHY